MLKNMNKTKKSNLITYAIVIVAFVVMQTLSSTGSISSLLTGTSCSALYIYYSGGFSEPCSRYSRRT